MKKSILSVPTLTVGLKAKKALEKAGIKVNLIKKDSDGAKKGCAYAIEFDVRYFYDVIGIMQEKELPYSG